MKHLFVILIGLSIILQSLSRIIIYVNFKINQEYIAKNLCVKKEVEDNCCQGSCHLKKQMEDEDNKEQAPVNPFKNVREFNIFCQNNLLFQFNIHLLFEGEFISFENLKISSPSFSIFHPPKV